MYNIFVGQLSVQLVKVNAIKNFKILMSRWKLIAYIIMKCTSDALCFVCGNISQEFLYKCRNLCLNSKILNLKIKEGRENSDTEGSKTISYQKCD